jgi:hypothetical protein
MAHHDVETTPYFGLMAEFNSAQELLNAAHKVREAGYTKTDAYSPFPIHGVAEALGMRERKIAPAVLMGGIIGGSIGYGCSTGRRWSATRSTSVAGRSTHGCRSSP